MALTLAGRRGSPRLRSSSRAGRWRPSSRLSLSSPRIGPAPTTRIDLSSMRSLAGPWPLLRNESVLAGVDDPESHINRPNLNADKGRSHLVPLDELFVWPLPARDGPVAKARPQ